MDYDTLVNNAVGALTKKENLMYEFLDITQSADFSWKMSDADAYTEYLSKRQSIIDKVDELDVLIAQLCQTPEVANNTSIINKKNTIKKTIEKIIILDDSIRSNMNKLVDDVGKNLRARNVHRSAQRQYTSNNTGSHGAFLDIRN